MTEWFRHSANDQQDAILSQEDAEALAMMNLKALAKSFVKGMGIELDKLEKLASTKEQPTDRELLRKLLTAPYADILRAFSGSFGRLGIFIHISDEDGDNFKAAKLG